MGATLDEPFYIYLFYVNSVYFPANICSANMALTARSKGLGRGAIGRCFWRRQMTKGSAKL